MKIIVRDNGRYVLRFDKGEELTEGLIKFAESEKIEAGWFFGIGAIQEIMLSHYDLDTKKYSDQEIKEKLEIISLLGNVAVMPARQQPEPHPPASSREASRAGAMAGGDKKIIIHAHGSFSNPAMEVRAGHVKKLIVGPTCEVFLIKLDGKIGREYSDEIGLNLMK